MLNFKEVTILLEGNYYLIQYKYEKNFTIHTQFLKGRLKNITMNKNSTEKNKIYDYEFYTIYNLAGTIVKNNNTNIIHSYDTLFYRFYSKKEKIQTDMELRTLRDIMRNILGDSFNHYLFSNIADLYHVYDKELEIEYLN